MQSILMQLFQSPFFSALSLVCVLLFLYSTYATYRIFFQSVKADREIKTLDKISPIWHLHDIRKHIKSVFQTIQIAVLQDNPLPLQNIMTQHLFAHFELAMSDRDDHHVKEIIKHAKLHGLSIVSVEKTQDDSDDAIWVYMDFSKTDFAVNQYDQTLVEGRPGLPQHYKQLWKFILENGQWHLDMIRENVHLADIEAVTSSVSR